MHPLVIGHRGASAHRPELTLAAFDLAFRLGADSVELDLLPTRDGHLVCRHDPELSATTDVASRPELAGRRRVVEIDGKVRRGWFVHDLTLAEIRTLTARERWPRKRAGSAAYDGRFGVPTFAEVLALVEAESARRGRPVHVHAELKHPAFLESVGLSLPDLLDGLRRPDVTWLSFDACVLRRLALRGHTALVRNFDDVPKGREVAETADYCRGIGVRREAVLPRMELSPDPSGPVGKTLTRAHRRGLDVLVWTHRAENKHLPEPLRIGRRPHAHGHGQWAAELLLAAGIDGLITDHPELGVAARTALLPTLPLAAPLA